MAANVVANIACAPDPIHPTWEELAVELKSDCDQPVFTPDRTFDFIYVIDHAGTLKPHTVCRFSAKCPRTLQFLAGITSFKNTRTIYITTHAYDLNGVFCFGHINIPEDDWHSVNRNNERIRNFHVRLYERMTLPSGQLSDDTLQDAYVFRFYAEKRKHLTGTLRNQRYWNIQHHHITRGNPNIPAAYQGIVASLTDGLADYLNHKFRDTD